VGTQTAGKAVRVEGMRIGVVREKDADMFGM